MSSPLSRYSVDLRRKIGLDLTTSAETVEGPNGTKDKRQIEKLVYMERWDEREVE